MNPCRPWNCSLNKILAIGTICAFLVGTSWLGAADVDPAILQAIEAANSKAKPEAASGVFVYEHWQRPRYIRASQFEDQIALQYKALEEKKAEMTPTQFAEVNEVIPVNMALKFMNDVYEKWQLEYRFSPDRVFSQRKLLEYTSRLEVPSNLVSNSRLQRFEPKANRQQTLAWNGSEFRNFSQINDETGEFLGIIGTTNDKSLERPPFSANVPPMSEMKDRIKSVQHSVDFNGKPALILELQAGAAENDLLRAYFQPNSYRFYALEKTGKQKDESLTHREVYEQDEMGNVLAGEISQIVRFDGIDVDQVFEQRRWTVEKIDFSVPPEDSFSPPIPESCAEIMIYNGRSMIIDELRIKSPKTFDRLIANLNQAKLSDVDSVREAVHSWKVGSSPASSWLLTINLILLAIGVALWFARRKTAKSSEGTAPL